MTDALTSTTSERAKASAWKLATTTLPAAAKVPSQYVSKNGSPSGPKYDFCLPAEHAALSLLPEVREPALSLFTELGIPWHAGIQGGPGNHLLSSQVQCVNALGQMVADPDRIIRAFGPILGTVEVHQIEPDRWLTFEYIGPGDYLNEAVGGKKTRGANCTSLDAAFLHTTNTGIRELVLVEWKYTEHYGRRIVKPAKDAVRYKRYGHLLAASDGPITSELRPFNELLQEPLYQLMRQQLLAHELERAETHGVDRVRVVHVLPSGNTAYQTSLYGTLAPLLGSTVKEVWQRLLRYPDRFVSIDSAMFLDPQITSKDYVERYGDALTPAPDDAIEHPADIDALRRPLSRRPDGSSAAGPGAPPSMIKWVDRSTLEAASWRLASELVRRHPQTTRILHTHPGDGQYDCLTITSPTMATGTIQLNRNGTIQVHQRFDGGPDVQWEPTSWDKYLGADPRLFLDRLEHAAGLPTPQHVPPSVPMTLTYRVLAAVAATAVKSVHPVEIHSGYLDTSGYGGGPNEALDLFPAVPTELRRARDTDLFGEPGYRFWIVLRDHVPILAFEQEQGVVWTPHHTEGTDLLGLYKQSRRNILIVTLELLRLADNV